MFKVDAPAWTPTPPIVDIMLPLKMPAGTTKPPPETSNDATKPPKGAEQGARGDAMYAAMKAVLRESVGDGMKIPSKSSNPE